MKDMEDLFLGLYNIDTQEQLAVHMCTSMVLREATPTKESRLRVVRVGKLKNGKAAG